MRLPNARELPMGYGIEENFGKLICLGQLSVLLTYKDLVKCSNTLRM